MNNREAIQAMLDGKKVRDYRWEPCRFVSYYNDALRTEDDIHFNINSYGIGDDWEIYKEPKKKVKMWQWVIKHSASGRICITDGFYTGKDSLPSPLEPVQKAEWTEIEMEIEE